MKNIPKQFWLGVGLGLIILIAIAAVPALTDFNANQFDTSGNKVAIKSGALQTNGAFSGTLTLNGSPVLTNATGGDTIWTNYTQTNAGNVISVLEETPLTNRFKLAVNSPFFDATWLMIGTASPDLSTLIDGTELYGIGHSPFIGTTVANSDELYGFGHSIFDSATVQGGALDIYGFGFSPFVSSTLDGAQNIYAFGDSGFSGATITDSTDLSGFGSFTFQDSILDNSERMTAYGDQCFGSSAFYDSTDISAIGSAAFANAIVTNSSYLFGFGVSPFDSATLTNSTALFGLGDAAFQSANIIGGDSIFAYGVRTLGSANLTNSSDIYAFGSDAGGGNVPSLTGSNLTHIFILGSNGRATNSNDFVFGDSLYNYFFPGASATFAALPTVNGIPLSTNSGGGTTVSVNATNVTTPNFTNTATVNYGISSSNVSANVVVPAGTATYLAGGSTANALVGVGIGAGLAMSGTNLTATATGSGVTEDVTTLGWSGTNITGFNCATNFQGYYLLATNNAHFGSSTFSNLPTKTQLRNFTLCIQQDSTGGRIISFTNSIVGWSLGPTNAPFIETNSGAVSFVYFHSNLATNNMLVATFNMDVR